ncbi:MAG: class I adenylate-forming enzyme family protein [Rhodospirillaceae bacterium]|nr:class I adenylate-forming enzyme family protein [Rhodospirillaceae bacterium]
MRVSLDNLGTIHDPAAGTAMRGAGIAAAVARRTGTLRRLGVAPGVIVVIAHGGSAHFFSDLLAVWQAGGCAACVNAALTPEELGNVVRFTDARLVLVGDGYKGGEPGALLIDTRAETDEPEAADDRASLDDPALILFTSGTTGDPKGVVHTFRSLLARLALNRAALGAATLARTLCVLPTHFGHGLIGNCLTPWLAGHDLYLFLQPGVAGAAKLGALLDENRISFMSSVPSFWKIALKMGKPPQGRSVQRIGIGSAPLSADLWLRVAAWSGAPVANMYGITETANWIGGASSDEFAPEDGLIGRLWGGSAAVLDGEGAMRSTGEGELLLQTPSLMQGYFKRPDLTDPVLKAGWFHTGDIGRIDEDGTMRLVGRQKDEINRAGQKVNPAEIDLFLERHPAIAEACCFGLPDAVSGEIVAAAVRLTDGARDDATALRAWAADRLRHELVPEKWFILADIPKTDRGKVSRRIVMQACLDSVKR